MTNKEPIRSTTYFADDQFEKEIREHLHKWGKDTNTPTTDQIIDAFEQGVKVGLEKQDKYARKVFIDNINNAFRLSELLLEWSKSEGITGVKAFLKIEQLDIFETLLLIDKENYLNKDIRNKIYERARGLRKENNSNTFNIEFTIQPNEMDINENLLENNGFYFQYKN